MALQVPAACESQLGGRADAARLAIIIDLLSGAFPSVLSGAADNIFTSANASAAPAAVTPAPTVGSNLVVDKLVISSASALTFTFTEETSGTVIGVFYLAANSTITVPLSKQLPTVNKRLMVQTSGAGNITIDTFYHSNP